MPSGDHALDPQDLFTQARSGNEAALGQLLERHSAQLLVLIEKWMGPDLRRTLEASDVLQEALLVAAQRFAQFKGTEDAAFRRWLFALSKRRLIDLARHNGRLKRMLKRERSLQYCETPSGEMLMNPVPLDLCTASQVASNREMSGQLAEALAHLSPREADALWLRYAEGMTLEEIGRKLGIGRNGVRGLVTRGLQKLRQVLPSWRG